MLYPAIGPKIKSLYNNNIFLFDLTDSSFQYFISKNLTNYILAHVNDYFSKLNYLQKQFCMPKTLIKEITF